MRMVLLGAQVGQGVSAEDLMMTMISRRVEHAPRAERVVVEVEDDMTYQLTVYLLPVIMLAASFVQPNISRSILSCLLVIKSAMYSALVMFTPDDVFIYTYIVDIITSFLVLYALSISETNGEWCISLMRLMLISIPINMLGGALWLAYSPPLLYNYAMLVVNTATVFAIMSNGASSGRLDELGVSFLSGDMGHRSWITFNKSKEAP